MTTTALAPTTAPVTAPVRDSARFTPKPATTASVIRSEWIKIRTLRSTWYSAAAVLVLIVGAGIGAALIGGGDTPHDHILQTVMTGTNIAVMIIACVGALVGAREFGTGMIRTTLSATPKRLPVLWGKLVAFAAVMLPTVLIGVVVAFFAGTLILHAAGAPSLTLGDPGVLRALIGNALYPVGIGLIGLTCGFMLRGVAAAIGTVIGGVLFLPSLAGALLPHGWSNILEYLPNNAATAFTSTGQIGATVLSPAIGVTVFALWIAAATAGAAATLTKRDA